MSRVFAALRKAREDTGKPDVRDEESAHPAGAALPGVSVPATIRLVNQDRQAILPHQHLDPMLPDRARSTQPVAAHEGPGSCSTVDEQAVRWTRNAAEQGYAAAQIALGDIYSEGRGVPQDQARALVWYRKAAEQGIAEAHRKVALMCANGQGVPQDHAQAVRWTRRHLEMKSDPA